MSDISYFTLNTKVKDYLRQSLEDKCSTVGGKHVYFGLNDAAIRMLTPIDEAVTPVPRTLFPPSRSRLLLPFYNSTTWILSNPEDFPVGPSDIDTQRSKCVLEPAIEPSIDINAARNKSDVGESKSSSFKTKRNNRIKKSRTSIGYKSNSPHKDVSRSHTNAPCQFRRSKQLLDRYQLDAKDAEKSDFQQKLTNKGQSVPGNPVLASFLHLRKKDLNGTKRKTSSRRKNGSGFQIRCVKDSSIDTIPEFDDPTATVPKKTRTCKSCVTNKVHSVMPVQRDQRASRSQSGLDSLSLPPIKPVSNRGHFGRRQAKEVKLTMSVLFHDTQEGGVTKMSPTSVSVVTNITVPNTTNRPGKQRIQYEH